MCAATESPPPTTKDQLGIRAIWWFGVLAWSYPSLLVAAFYGTWLMAWFVLGHMPRPWIDDPKSISIAVYVPYVWAGILLVGCPAAALAGVVIQLSIPQRSLTRRVLRCTVMVLLWGATIAFLRGDPMFIGKWYID